MLLYVETNNRFFISEGFSVANATFLSTNQWCIPVRDPSTGARSAMDIDSVGIRAFLSGGPELCD